MSSTPAFNPEQLAFINCDADRVFLFATAGSGKTRCCSAYSARQIQQGIRPDQILSVTFTRKAAAEFTERLSKETQLPPNAFTAGTFHSICHLLIREDSKSFGLHNKHFSVLDEKQSNRLIRQIARDLQLPSEIEGRKIQDLVSLARNTLYLPADVTTSRQLTAGFSDLIVRYRAELDSRNCTDYDGLLEKVLARMGAQPEYAQKLRTRWPRVIVDEMQDSNALNFEFLKALNPDRLVCVGDANQSIYEWRGANNRLIDTFVQEQKATVLTMRTNYRAGQKILDAANSILVETTNPISMKSGVGDGGSIATFRHDDDIAEAEQTANWISRVIRAGWKPKDIAVLSRTARALRRVETALKTRGIDYRTYHGRSIAESPHIRDATALIRAAYNRTDSFAIEHVAGFFPGTGPAEASRLAEAPKLIPTLAPAMHQLLETVHGLPPAAMFEQLPEMLAPVFARKYKKDHEKRIVDLRALCTQMAAKSPDEFVSAFEIEQDMTPVHPEHCVTLSTVHSAKGLEWPFVWVVDASDRAFGHKPQSKERLPANESMRLFYVAVTRAREMLIVSCPAFAMGSKRQPCNHLSSSYRWTLDHDSAARGRILEARGAHRVRNPIRRTLPDTALGER